MPEQTPPEPGPWTAVPDLTPLPPTAVTCMEDRAQIERDARVELPSGVSRLRLGPVTPLAVDHTLRAFTTAPGVGVVDARLVRTYTPPHPDDAAPRRGRPSELRVREKELEHEVRVAGRRGRRLEERLAVVRQARDELHREIVGAAAAGSADPQRWAEQSERLDGELEQCRDLVREAAARHAELCEERDQVHTALRRVEQEPPQVTAYVEVVVEAEHAGTARIGVSHLVPCALWRPAYRATLAADGRSLELRTEAVVWQCTGEDWDDVSVSLSTARTALAAAPPELAEDVLTLRDRTAEERRTVDVELREEEISTLGGESPDAAAVRTPELPGLADGGEVRVLAAPARARVPSDGRPYRLHLSAFRTSCRAELTCSPELSPLVSQVARFTNDAGHVLLAGPVDLVRGSGFTGRGEVRFAGMGEEVRLSFGSEDTYRVVRHAEERRDTTGVAGIGQRTVVIRTVRLFVSRVEAPDAGTAAAEIVVRERVPVSEVSAVEVTLDRDACRPAPPDEGPDADGIVTYRVRLEPGERRELVLVCELRAAKSVVGL
ncbi:mucoidy inhibitor MuiA family protein [Streptomyces sp. NPDC051940]|uniref:mucoidy inhibitor MuiA family protein n=1 Tax=Streptomyces sp. NPDC051940 TaxID=3155675 RepID=UPI00342D705E